MTRAPVASVKESRLDRSNPGSRSVVGHGQLAQGDPVGVGGVGSGLGVVVGATVGSTIGGTGVGTTTGGAGVGTTTGGTGVGTTTGGTGVGTTTGASPGSSGCESGRDAAGASPGVPELPGTAVPPGSVSTRGMTVPDSPSPPPSIGPAASVAWPPSSLGRSDPAVPGAAGSFDCTESDGSAVGTALPA